MAKGNQIWIFHFTVDDNVLSSEFKIEDEHAKELQPSCYHETELSE